MNSKLAHFEKYSVAPSPSRDYYGLKIFNNEVILYLWKVSHGPHLLPVVRKTKFSEFNEDKLLKDEIQYAFGSTILNYLELITLDGTNTLLTLPRFIIEKLVKYLNLEDIVKLFCVSKVGHEIFNTNAIWEIFYKRFKRSSKLSDMEKDIGVNQGFKKLVKDHHARVVSKKHLKSFDDKSARSPKTSSRSEKIVRSASVNLPKSSLQPDVKSIIRKQSIDYTPAKVDIPIKSPVKVTGEVKKKKFTKAKEGASKETALVIEKQKLMEKNAAGEGYREMKLMSESSMKSKSERKTKITKSKVVEEEREKKEILIQKEQLKSVILQADLSDEESKEFISRQSLALRSPKSIFTRRSPHTLIEAKPKATEKTAIEKKSKTPKGKTSSTIKLDLKKYVSCDKSDDSDGSGMSFLMKRYLEASDDVAKKFSECERLAHSTKNSSTQVSFDEKTERKPIKKTQKYMTTVEKPMSRNVGSATNLFAKLKSFKKN